MCLKPHFYPLEMYFFNLPLKYIKFSKGGGVKNKKLISKGFLNTYGTLSIMLELMGILRIRYDLCFRGTHGPFGKGLTCGTTVNGVNGVVTV